MTRAVIHLVLLGAALLLAQGAAGAQTPAQEFELDITERRIVESDFRAATSAEAGGDEPGGLHLRVGAAVRASEIDVLLRNVRGRVRFRASLGPVLRLLDARRAAARGRAP